MKDCRQARKRLVQQIAQISNATKTNPFISSVTAVSRLSVLAVMVWYTVAVPWHYFLSPVLMLAAVPMLRALENLGGHEGGHGNWLRKRPRTNDWLANMFAAWWVVTSAQSFREKHNNHHHYFGEPADPCFTRFSMFHLARLKSWPEFISALRREYPGYLREYWVVYTGVKAPQVMRALALHGVVMMVGSWLWQGFWFGWLLLVIAPFLLILPVLRMVAESQEHDYDGSDELTDSYNNVSWFSRLYIHPVGDAYHKLHHLQPTIPHFRMRRVHVRLMAVAPEYRNSHKPQPRKGPNCEPKLSGSQA